MILSGDAGATKTELAIYSSNENNILEKICSQKYSSKDFSSLENVILEFLKDKKLKIHSSCIGVPGPVLDGKAVSTNLDWILDEKILSEKLNIKNLKLANDLEIMAAAIPSLTDNDLITLHKGEGANKNSNKALIAPGTGLGQAALIYSEGKYIIAPSEGGHTDFAPQNEIETKLLNYLQSKFGHVSYERIASGEGIVNIFNFLIDTNYGTVNREFLNRLENEDAAALITTEAVSERNKVCVKSLDIFTSVLGAQAGNMVLNYLATGGVYLCGGIPLKILYKFKDNTFLNSFFNKGRMKYLIERTPVHIVRDSSIGLKGAAMLARNK